MLDSYVLFDSLQVCVNILYCLLYDFRHHIYVYNLHEQQPIFLLNLKQEAMTVIILYYAVLVH